MPSTIQSMPGQHKRQHHHSKGGEIVAEHGSVDLDGSHRQLAIGFLHLDSPRSVYKRSEAVACADCPGDYDQSVLTLIHSRRGVIEVGGFTILQSLFHRILSCAYHYVFPMGIGARRIGFGYGDSDPQADSQKSDQKEPCASACFVPSHEDRPHRTELRCQSILEP